MDNIVATRKWSEMHGMAIVTLAEGKKVGTLDDFYFDVTTSNIYALRIKTSLFGHKLLPIALINSIGQDAIIIQNDVALSDESADDKLSTYGLGRNLLSYKIMSASGNVIGLVGNLLIETSAPKALRIAEFEFSGSLRERISKRYQSFSSSQLLQYGHDVLVVPDEVAQLLQ
jgi:uncharacterized protein YrrD